MKKKLKKVNRVVRRTTPINNWFLLGTIFVFVFALVSFKVYRTSIEPDSHCFVNHTPISQPPAKLKTASDYFLQGDYEYEKGSCDKAVQSYTKTIELSPKSAEAYNNRGYTYMRIRDYEKALVDLNKAIELRPDYVNALMNRGDIYNYYFSIDYDKALADYDKILSLGAPPEGSLCGHRLLAKNKGWSPNVILQILTKGVNAGCLI